MKTKQIIIGLLILAIFFIQLSVIHNISSVNSISNINPQSQGISQLFSMNDTAQIVNANATGSGTNFTAINGIYPLYAYQVNISNTQSVATVGNFSQMITVAISSNAYFALNLQNANWQYANGTLVFSWLETFLYSGNAIYWLNLQGNSIPATTGKLTVYLCVYITSLNVYDDYYTGAYPTYSGALSQYDNGALVFPYYLACPSSNTGWTDVIGSGTKCSYITTAPAGSHTGTTDAMCVYAGGNGCYMYTNIPILSTNEIISYDAYSSGIGDCELLASSGGNGQCVKLDTRDASGDYDGFLLGMTGWTTEGIALTNGIIMNTMNQWTKTDIVISGTSATYYLTTAITNSLATYGTSCSVQTIVNDGTYLGLLGDGYLATTCTDWNNLIIRYLPPTNVMPSTVIGSAITQGSGSILNITTSFNESAIPLANIQSFSLFCNMSSNATISTLNTVNESLYNFNVQQSQIVTNILPTTSTFVNIATSAQAYFNTSSWLNCTFKWFNITGINLMMNFTIQLQIWYYSPYNPFSIELLSQSTSITNWYFDNTTTNLHYYFPVSPYGDKNVSVALGYYNCTIYEAGTLVNASIVNIVNGSNYFTYTEPSVSSLLSNYNATISTLIAGINMSINAQITNISIAIINNDNNNNQSIANLITNVNSSICINITTAINNANSTISQLIIPILPFLQSLNDTIQSFNSTTYTQLLGISVFETAMNLSLWTKDNMTYSDLANAIMNESVTQFLAASSINSTILQSLADIIAFNTAFNASVNQQFADQLLSIQGMNATIIADILANLGYDQSMNYTLSQLLNAIGIQVNTIDQTDFPNFEQYAVQQFNTIVAYLSNANYSLYELNATINGLWLFTNNSFYILNNQTQWSFIQLNNSIAFVQSHLDRIDANLSIYSVYLQQINGTVANVTAQLSTLINATFLINGSLYQCIGVLNDSIVDSNGTIIAQANLILSRITPSPVQTQYLLTNDTQAWIIYMLIDSIVCIALTELYNVVKHSAKTKIEEVTEHIKVSGEDLEVKSEPIKIETERVKNTTASDSKNGLVKRERIKPELVKREKSKPELVKRNEEERMF